MLETFLASTTGNQWFWSREELMGIWQR